MLFRSIRRNTAKEHITSLNGKLSQHEGMTEDLYEEKMLGEESISYEKLQVEQYVTDLHDYWKDNRTVFKLDSVSFLYIWGSMLTWTMITALCLIIGALSYSKLPTEIPVQWSKGVVKSVVVLLFVDTAIFIGLLVVGLVKMDLRGKEVL